MFNPACIRGGKNYRVSNHPDHPFEQEEARLPKNGFNQCNQCKTRVHLTCMTMHIGVPLTHPEQLQCFVSRLLLNEAGISQPQTSDIVLNATPEHQNARVRWSDYYGTCLRQSHLEAPPGALQCWNIILELLLNDGCVRADNCLGCDFGFSMILHARARFIQNSNQSPESGRPSCAAWPKVLSIGHWVYNMTENVLRWRGLPARVEVPMQKPSRDLQFMHAQTNS
eukprot:1740306-Amphidinium_carterae.1